LLKEANAEKSEPDRPSESSQKSGRDLPRDRRAKGGMNTYRELLAGTKEPIKKFKGGQHRSPKEQPVPHTNPFGGRL